MKMAVWLKGTETGVEVDVDDATVEQVAEWFVQHHCAVDGEWNDEYMVCVETDTDRWEIEVMVSPNRDKFKAKPGRKVKDDE